MRLAQNLDKTAQHYSHAPWNVKKHIQQKLTSSLGRVLAMSVGAKALRRMGDDGRSKGRNEVGISRWLSPDCSLCRILYTTDAALKPHFTHRTRQIRSFPLAWDRWKAWRMLAMVDDEEARR
jgi:hypothetical protein